MKLQKSVWYILLLIFGSISYFLLFTYQNIQRNKESFNWVNRTQEVIKTINTVRSNLYEVESGIRGFVISGNPTFLDQHEKQKTDLTTEATQLLQLINDNPQQQQNGRQLLDLIQQKLLFQNQVYNATKISRLQAEATIASMKGKRLTDSLESIFQRMEKEERQLLAVRMKEHQSLTDVRYTTTIILSIVVVILFSSLLINIIKENMLRRKAESRALENESKYKTLIENSAIVVYTTDKNGYYTYLSGKCKDFTGFHPEELVGEHFLLLVEKSWEQKVMDFYMTQQKSRTKETVFEFPILTKSGERKWIEQSVVMVEENGEPTGFHCVAKDITEKKYGERLLADAENEIKAKQQEYQARLQSILDNMPMIVYLKDLEGKFMMVNRQFHDVFGTTDREVIGKREMNVHLDEDSARKFLAIDEEIKNTLQHKEVSDVILTKDGQRNMSIVKFPLLDKEGNLIAISAVGKDITENIRYQQQLIEARERAEKAERLQEEFLANMSHEIRTPMNGIIGMTDLMETTFLNGEQKEYLRLIKESSQILLALINDILDLSKIKAGRMTIELIDYNLQNTVDAVVAPFCLKAKEKGITINKTVDQFDHFIIGDQHKLIQILNNLLSNAIKFTEKGSVSVTVTTEEDENNLRLVCTVKDTGMGIAKENLDYIFQSFVQAGNDMVRRFGGTGLGLAITKRLIELQGGQITVCSEVGEGTTFRFQVPIEKSNLVKSSNETIAPQEEIDAKSLRFKKILLIEDNEVNQKVTFLMLHKAGIFVDIANNGVEAIQFLESGRTYDLIITDLQMPEMDGFQTTQYIRNELQLQTPIIAMTASALRNEKEKCFQLGMNEYLTKPFSPNVLFLHLKRYLLAKEENAQPAEETLVGDSTELYSMQFLHEMEDVEYTAEVLELFLKTTPPTLNDIAEKVQQQDWEEVYRKAHSLKSSLGLLQMNRMLESVSSIEQFAKTKRNTDKIDALLNNVLQQYGLVKPMLEAELSLTRKNTVV